MNKSCLIYVTVKDEEEGILISKLLIKKKLAACANLYPKVKSIFPWKDKIEVGNEAVLILKTTEKKYDELEKFIVKNHSYELPCILKLPIKKGEGNFMEWLQKTVLSKS